MAGIGLATPAFAFRGFNCVAGGDFSTSSCHRGGFGATEGFVVSQVNGACHLASQLTSFRGQFVQVTSVACAAR